MIVGNKGQAATVAFGAGTLLLILGILFGLTFLLGGLPILLAVLTHSKLLLVVIGVVVLWRLGVFDRWI